MTIMIQALQFGKIISCWVPKPQGNRMKVFLVLRNLCIIPKSTLRSQ
ncbi:MAG: hypothetical protein BECKG1743F_GA0114225_104166, partial [Candidatus Kentron sp. G]